jgi:hypothetical protein
MVTCDAVSPPHRALVCADALLRAMQHGTRERIAIGLIYAAGEEARDALLGMG